MACCLFYAAAFWYRKHAQQDISYQAYPFKPCALFLSIFAGR